MTLGQRDAPVTHVHVGKKAFQVKAYLYCPNVNDTTSFLVNPQSEELYTPVDRKTYRGKRPQTLIRTIFRLCRERGIKPPESEKVVLRGPFASQAHTLTFTYRDELPIDKIVGIFEELSRIHKADVF